MAYLGKTRGHPFYYNAKEDTIDLSRKLRSSMTPGEKFLWKKLRRKKIGGVRFRRQHPVEYFVADFYCHEARLVIEVDGPVHDSKERREKDAQRDGEMEFLGIVDDFIPSPNRVCV